MRLRKLPPSLAAVFLAAALPALAGNYAEGDPRPGALPGQRAAAEVRAETRQWMAAAPTLGYPEGDPKAAAPAGRKSRAEVHAEALAWVRSGMAGLADGEVPFDSRGPSYDQALRAFDTLRAGRHEAAARPAAPAAVR